MPARHSIRNTAISFTRYAVALLCWLSLSWAAVAADASESAPVVTVTGGKIRGKYLPEGGGAVFKGIPFAQPPVGPLRWRDPQPVVPWSGIREAVESGPPAAQRPLGWNDALAAASREDCLYLDVWTPTRSNTAHKPVMVWFHGGANLAGAGGADPLYDGRSLISHDVVLVVIEYRLGIFGFLAHPELTKESRHHSSGNYAILDQIVALRWIRKNIEKFGGDSGNVTLFGQSAGSIDILALMTSPTTEGLFQRAIAESGALARSMTQPLDKAEQAGVLMAEKLNAPASGALAFLRSLPADVLLKAEPGPTSFKIDGWVFPAGPAETFAQGNEHEMPLIIGSTAVELAAPGSPADMEAVMRKTFGDLAPKALALYGLAPGATPLANDPLYGDLAEQWGSDQVRCPIVIHGAWHSAAKYAVWEYEFARAIPPRPKVGHSSDLPYVFGNLYAKGNQAGDFQAADIKLAMNVQTYWTNFARTGNPNGKGLPLWPNYDGTTKKYLRFTTDGDILVGENQRGPFCDLFRELLNSPVAAR